MRFIMNEFSENIFFTFFFSLFRYKRKLIDMLNDEDERQSRKYARVSEKQRKTEEKYLGISEINASE